MQFRKEAVLLIQSKQETARSLLCIFSSQHLLVDPLDCKPLCCNVIGLSHNTYDDSMNNLYAFSALPTFANSQVAWHLL